MSKHAEMIFAAIEAADATSSLISSWRRSAQVHGLHPDRTMAPERDSSALREALDRDGRMVALAMSYIDELYDVLDETDAVVCLTDRAGLVLAQRTGRTHDLWRRGAAEVVGTRYAESDVGTTPFAIALVDERPLIMGCGQCFMLRFTPNTGISAPIFGPDSQVAGTLTCWIRSVPGPEQSSRANLIYLVVANFARRIGIALFATAFPKAKLVQVSRDGSVPCAMIAVAPDDSVLGASRTARRLLGLSDAQLASPLGVRDLFGAPTLDDLAAAEAKLIAQAMACHANNRSAVAKALGISRSTLYRKLSDLRWGKRAVDGS